jgi:hypothetical protein
MFCDVCADLPGVVSGGATPLRGHGRPAGFRIVAQGPAGTRRRRRAAPVARG